MNIFFTSDTHFCHDKEFCYGPRGFSSVDEMNEAIIERWNSVVKPGDVVYHLGDVMLNDTEKGIECIKKLNGYIFLIYGNHDTDNRIRRLYIDAYGKIYGGYYAYLIKDGKMRYYLSHYPTLTANYDEKHFSQHVINLHGHTHQSRSNWISITNPFTYHVGVDSHNCTPVHIDEVTADIKQYYFEISKLPQSAKPNDVYPYNNLI